MRDVTGSGWQLAWTEEAVEVLDKIVRPLKQMTVDIFDEHGDTCFCTLKYYLLDHMLEDLHKKMTLNVLNSSSYGHCNVHIRHWYRSTSPKWQTWIMETMNFRRSGDRYQNKLVHMTIVGSMVTFHKNKLTCRLDREFLKADAEDLDCRIYCFDVFTDSWSITKQWGTIPKQETTLIALTIKFRRLTGYTELKQHYGGWFC